MIALSHRRVAFGAVLLLLVVAAAGYVTTTMLGQREPFSDGPAVHDAGVDLRFQRADGAMLSLADFQGRTILLNVWATWCPPCREEMPSLDRLQEARGDESFEVVALSIDTGGIERVQPFFEQIGIRHLNTYLDPSMSSMSALNLVGLPTTLLIASDGTEIARWVGPKEWDDPQTIAQIDSAVGNYAEGLSDGP